MRVGLVTPIVIGNPAAVNPWEADASPGDLVEVVRAADRFGYHHVAASEHVAIPASESGRRGTRYYDPLATLAFLAAHTERVRLFTHCLVLGYHHPLQIAKRYGTLDVLSGGRVIVGVGVGSLREEFDLLGVPFDGRGERADDAIRALRASLGRREPAYDGTHHRFSGMAVEPHAPREDVPIWVGGHTRRSLRRAIELGDGWVPWGLDPDDLRALLADVDVPDGFDLVFRPGHRLLDPAGDPGGVREVVEEYAALGTTVLNIRVASRSVEEEIEQLDALMELVGTSGKGRDANEDREDV